MRTLFSFCLFLSVLISCQTLQKGGDRASGEFAEEPKVVNPKGTVQLTFVGTNSQGVFSKDGKWIAMASSNRDDHQNRQLYIYNPETRQEVRITHQDGDVAYPVFHPRKNILVFSSTTDEVKEHPDIERLLEEKSSESPSNPYDSKKLDKMPTELYASYLDGSRIWRITRSAGFDGEATYSKKAKHLAFASHRKGSKGLYLVRGDGKRLRILRRNIRINYSMPRYSPNGRSLIWVQSKTEGISHIYLGNNWAKRAKPLTDGDFEHTMPNWHPKAKGIVFSSNRDGKEKFSLYFLSLPEKCLTRITSENANDLFPVFSPDGSKILFTSDRSGTDQLYLMDFVEPSGCEITEK